ncbi:MAG: HEAT repeat domain-containing protein [Planctomycetota bacterium]
MLSVCAALITCGCNDSSSRLTDWPEPASVRELIPQATRIVREGLADPSPLTRVNAIEVVATTRRIRFMPDVQRLLRDQFFTVRFAAALAVGDLEYSLGESSVRQLLSDQNENVRLAAAYTMSKLGHANGLDVLARAIASSDLIVRANAALLLGKTGDRRALKSLYIALRREDSDDKVRFQAAESIAKLGDERIYPKLWTMLISAFADVRIIGIRAMGALGTTEARNALLTMLEDGVLEVRLVAAEQLGMLGDISGQRVVLEVFAKNLTAGLDDLALERVNVLTALAIGRIGTESVGRFLPRLLKDRSQAVRLAAAKAVFDYVMRSGRGEKLPI